MLVPLNALSSVTWFWIVAYTIDIQAIYCLCLHWLVFMLVEHAFRWVVIISVTDVPLTGVYVGWTCSHLSCDYKCNWRFTDGSVFMLVEHALTWVVIISVTDVPLTGVYVGWTCSHLSCEYTCNWCSTDWRLCWLNVLSLELWLYV